MQRVARIQHAAYIALFIVFSEYYYNFCFVLGVFKIQLRDKPQVLVSHLLSV